MKFIWQIQLYLEVYTQEKGSDQTNRQKKKHIREEILCPCII